MKKKVYSFIMSVVAIILSAALTLPLFACSGNDEEETPTASPQAQNFVNYVIRIETPITLDSEAFVDGALILYEHLSDADKQNADVVSYKATLDGYKEQVTELLAQKAEQDAAAEREKKRNAFTAAVRALPKSGDLQLSDKAAVEAAKALYAALDADSKTTVTASYNRLMQAEAEIKELERLDYLAKQRAAAEKFIADVNGLGEITLESNYTLRDIEYAYKNLSAEALAVEGVAEAKQKLDEAKAEYQDLKDAKDVEDFNKKVKALPKPEDIALSDRKGIVDAESLYKNMSDAAKSGTGVAESYEKLVGCRERYDVLFLEDQKIKVKEFIAVAEKVPTDIENVNIEWYVYLDPVGDAYEVLSDASKALPEVQAACERWDAAQIAFNRLGYEKLPLGKGALLEFSGDTPPFLVLAQANFFPALQNHYGVKSIPALAEYAYIMLNVYVDGKLEGRGRIEFDDPSIINDGHIIRHDPIIRELKKLSQTNSNIKSGANFSFTLSFADKNMEYIPSRESVRTPQKNTYTW